MAKTRKNKVLSEQFIRSKLTVKNYDAYLDKTFISEKTRSSYRPMMTGIPGPVRVRCTPYLP